MSLTGSLGLQGHIVEGVLNKTALVQVANCVTVWRGYYVETTPELMYWYQIKAYNSTQMYVFITCMYNTHSASL